MEADNHNVEHRNLRGVFLWVIIGGVIGASLTGLAVWTFMPDMMLTVRESKLSFAETVEAIQQAIPRQGWVLSGTTDIRKTLAKHGREFPREVRIIKLCQPDYAKRVLTGHRELAALMPCSIAVYEGDDGKVYISKMNTGLMGKMFGGTVAEVMGGEVARDERAILSGVVSEK